MAAILVELDPITVTTLKHHGLREESMADAVRDAVWFTYGDDPNVEIDIEIAEEFERNRIGVTGEETIAWLQSLGTSAPVAPPKLHFIAPVKS
jgi:hypothetical protein